MSLNHLIFKILFLICLPYYISTKFIKHQNGQESLHKKIDSKIYSLEMLNIPNLEPNINRNGLMHSSDNFVRRIPLYTYTPYFLGYLDEHEQIRKEKETFEESKRKSQYLPNKFDDSEMRDALTMKKKNEEILSNNKKFKNIINDDDDYGDDNIKEALEIIKKIAEQKTTKNHNKTKFKKNVKKFRNDDLATEESAENFNVLKNNRQKPIKSKTKKSIVIENADDDDDAASYLEIYNQNSNEKIGTPKRGKRFDEIIENNPQELLNALITHEIKLGNNNDNDVGKDQGVCKYLELANILGCLGNKEKINNICKSLLSACTCPACKQKKAASEIVFNYTNLTDSDSEEEKFFYDHSNESMESHLNVTETYDKFLNKMSDQIEKNESQKSVNNSKSAKKDTVIKDIDLNKNLATGVNDGKIIDHKKDDKEVKVTENLPTENNEKIHFIEHTE